MSAKTKKPLESIEIEGELLNFVSYAAYYLKLPLFTSFKIFNRDVQSIEGLTVSVTGNTKLILPQTLEIKEIPRSSSVEAVPENILNPAYLAGLEEPETCTVEVKVTCKKTVICTLAAEVCALPIDFWAGLSGNPEMLAAFVRPKLSDCQKILAEAGLQLKTWGYSSEFSGYANDKNSVRSAAAAVFSAIRNLNIEKEGGADLSSPNRAGAITDIVAERRASPLQLAVFAASCLECIKLNPVILIGKKSVGVGVWLYESCFSSPVQDDMQIISKYMAAGVNNLSVSDAEDMFAHKNASYATSEGHITAALQNNSFEICLDIRRCRMGGIYPLPIKIKTPEGYELLGDKQASYSEKPAEIVDSNRYKLGLSASKDRNWQRRLLDLSQKNNLLNFHSRESLHIVTGGVSSFAEKLENKNSYILAAGEPDFKIKPFGDGIPHGMAELLALEMNDGKLRVAAGQEALAETAQNLFRKARSAEEESGAGTLFLAAGFLKWKKEGEREEKFAPLALLPVTLKRQKNRTFALETGEGYEPNTTLLEFLKQEFGIDVRGLEGSGLSPAEIISVFRAETADMRGWNVYDDVYVAQFTFARYAMWEDVKENIEKYRKNPLIESLLTNTNKLAGNKLAGADEDLCDPAEILTPLPSDSAQYAAVAEADSGATFVLHGPPGTGKSQTISNMIANALYKGKRVLFVAEKQAALQVVKKRLSEIGIGEFCLELHSGKTTDKAEIIKNIQDVLSQSNTGGGENFAETAEKIVDVREKLRAPLDALHKTRRLGVSVYEGIILYLQNKSAPELMDIETAFYDGLTKKKLEQYENMLSCAQAAAAECGGVYRSPFSEVKLTSCGADVKASVMCAAEVALAELRHLKNYLGLFLETFNQKVSRFTFKKLENSVLIAQILQDGGLKEFFLCDEGEFYRFYNANLRYDSEVSHWLKNFKALPDIGKFAPEIESEIDNWGENYAASRVLSQVLKRINRCARSPLDEKDALEWIKRANEIEKAKNMLLTNTKLSEKFTGFGGINEKKRAEFLKPLNDLHALCAQTFMDYNADAFNSVCASAAGGALKPLIAGYIGAARAFTESAHNYLRTIKADESAYDDADIFEIFSQKCSALIDNIDMLPSWCRYKATAAELNACGLTFMTDAMERGRISGAQVLSSFRKNVYRNFVQTNIPADENLAAFSASVADGNAAEFARLLEEFSALSRERIKNAMISRLPAKETEGQLALELMAFQRQTKGNLRGLSLRALFAQIPALLKVAAPCMLMSPITVSQYLPPDPEFFDLVIFDEASQIPTCEAVLSLARAKSAVIVGDPRQMPPTSFFTGTASDEEAPETEDMESVLDDCLALGIPEKHLIWHYRSKHESLIAFSNINYYSSRLCTFPSPDEMESRVKLRYIENGVYERGAGKYNKLEAEALVNEVISRLKDVKSRRSSLGIVTFSMPQQLYIEKLLSREIAKNGLEEAAYEREEPLFVKNLENVQGDERDVILFSVCYGPDKEGKISLNFGPLNQFGGWRRLNVAVSRAREEMVVFSSIRYSVIDMSRTTSRGVAGLKAFLEFAEKGRANIAVRSNELIVSRDGIGKYIAEELSSYGYDCRADVGVSDFKIDVAVVDPKDPDKYILAVLCDGTRQFSVKDRSVMQVQTLKRNNWNVLKLYTVNFFNNPKREIKKIKDFLDKLTAGEVKGGISFKRQYRYAKFDVKQADSATILGGGCDEELIKVLKAVVSAEEPVSTQFLIKRALSAFGISKYGVKLESKLRSLIDKCGFLSREILGNVYYCRSDRYISFDRYRVEEGAPVRTQETDYTPYDIISVVRGILLSKVSMYLDELVPAVLREFKVPRATDKMQNMVLSCVEEGVRRGLFIKSVSDKISLA